MLGFCRCFIVPLFFCFRFLRYPWIWQVPTPRKSLKFLHKSQVENGIFCASSDRLCIVKSPWTEESRLHPPNSIPDWLERSAKKSSHFVCISGSSMSAVGSSLSWQVVAGTNRKIMFTYIRLKGNNGRHGLCFLIIYVSSQNLHAICHTPISLALVLSTSIVNRFSLNRVQFWRRAGLLSNLIPGEVKSSFVYSRKMLLKFEGVLNIADHFRLVDALALP